MKPTLEKKLECCPLFEGIRDLSFLTRCLAPRLQRLEAGQSLHWEGVGNAAIVVDGWLEGEEMCQGPGSVLGMERALLGVPGPAEWARRKSAVLLLAAEGLVTCCKEGCPEHRQLAVNARKVLARHNLELQARQTLLLIRGTRARLLAYLEGLRVQAGRDTFQLPGSRRAMAEYLNLSRPSLSRELGALRDEGAIAFYRETVKLLTSG